MTRLLVLLAVFIINAPFCFSEQPPPLAEKYLHSGKLAEGETALLLALESNPMDDEVRFGLGVIQFMRAVENVGRELREYGTVSVETTPLFLRLLVPKNENPKAIRQEVLGRLLDTFAAELARADATLADIKDEQVKLRLRLNKVAFDFVGSGKDRVKLLDLLNDLNLGRCNFENADEDFRFHLDRGDVAWLRGYGHLLCAMIEYYRGTDQEEDFAYRIGWVFPSVESAFKKPEDDRLQYEYRLWHSTRLSVDAPRIRKMRIHLVMYCELNREFLMHICKETDDDYEWIPNPKQRNQIGLPSTEDRINTKLRVLATWEKMLKGELLISNELIRVYDPKIPSGQGLNLKLLLDDGPVNRQSTVRDDGTGVIDTKYLEAEDDDTEYLEAEDGKPAIGFEKIFLTLIKAPHFFNGPFGILHESTDWRSDELRR